MKSNLLSFLIRVFFLFVNLSIFSYVRFVLKYTFNDRLEGCVDVG